MENIFDTKGYNLHMMSLDNWVFDDNSGNLFDGTFATVLVYATTRGFLIGELEQGVEWMLEKNHDSIHFGMYKSPIFTFARNERKKVA